MLSKSKGTNWIIANLLYGFGSGLTGALRLRVKDSDFACKQVIVRGSKGGNDRVTVLTEKLFEPLKRQLAIAKNTHERDLSRGSARVELPFALEGKYPNAKRKWS